MRLYPAPSAGAEHDTCLFLLKIPKCKAGKAPVCFRALSGWMRTVEFKIMVMTLEYQGIFSQKK